MADHAFQVGGAVAPAGSREEASVTDLAELDTAAVVGAARPPAADLLL